MAQCTPTKHDLKIFLKDYTKLTLLIVFFDEKTMELEVSLPVT
jgi:hypothetical protein